MKRLDLIEFLKGYSIFTIIVFHFLQTMHLTGLAGQLISFGGTGVHLFILISGFGLYLSNLNKPLKFYAFLKKRFSKIYFPYIIVVLISALVSLIIPIYKNSSYALAGHLFLFKMFDESIIGSYGYPLWFISMIIQFYLMFGLIKWLKEKIGNIPFLSFSIIVSLLWALFIVLIGKETERVWNSFFLRYLWEFALGMILADWLVNKNLKERIKVKSIYILIFGVFNCILYALMALKGGETGKMFNDIPALIGYSFLAIWLYQMKIGVINRFLIYTGKISYSLYLWHTIIMVTTLYLFKDISLLISLPIAFLLVYFISELWERTLPRVVDLACKCGYTNTGN